MTKARVKLVGQVRLQPCQEEHLPLALLITADWEFGRLPDGTPEWEHKDGAHYLCGWPFEDLIALTKEYGVGFRFDKLGGSSTQSPT